MMDLYYILDGKLPQAVDFWTHMQWLAAIGDDIAKLQVGRTEIADEVDVSTVFLGYNCNVFGDEPVVFETMVFGGERDGLRFRWRTWEDAETGHEAVVKYMQTGEEVGTV